MLLWLGDQEFCLLTAQTFMLCVLFEVQVFADEEGIFVLRLVYLTPLLHPSSHWLFQHNNKRHVILPKELAKTLPKTRLLTENEWRSIGVQQSRGWEHYAIHRPEPHILLFRRPLGTDPQTGAVNLELKRQALEEYKGQFGLRG